MSPPISEEGLIALLRAPPLPKMSIAQGAYLAHLRWKRAKLQIELAAMQARVAEADHLIGEALAEMRRGETDGA